MRIYWKRSKLFAILVLFLCLVFLLYFHRKNTNPDLDDLSLDSLDSLNSLQINLSIYRYRLKRYKSYQDTQYKRMGPGENGADVKLTENEIKNLNEVIRVEAFNRPTSDRISLERSLPDYRSAECKAVTYPADLPTVSVVIIFHNEAWTTLLRTVHSVVNRSPPRYLKEVILLDDCSYKVGLGTSLDKYISSQWPDGVVKVVRRKTRLGLIKARLEGAKEATGDVLMFLDSHCEVTNGWLQPLLFRIYQKHSTMMIPVIDGIDEKNFKYQGSEGMGNVGTFWWSMHFTWEDIPAHFKAEIKSPTDPVKSATMAGGLFAADRKYFFDVGSYDEGMEIWGGENLELSFRVWTCGGSLESTPCSHVGHIFRASHPYTFPGNKDYHGLNSKRMVDVWLDDYKRLFYIHRPSLKMADAGDVSSRVELRKRLQCKPFSWYVKNVVPHKFIPDENVIAFGFVKNSATNMCLDLIGQNEFDRGSLVTGVYTCQPANTGSQMFSLYPVKASLSPNKNNQKDRPCQIRREYGCLTATQLNGTVSFVNCADILIDTQLWIHDLEHGSIANVKFGQCLDTIGLKSLDTILIKQCDPDHAHQKWKFQSYFP